MSIPLPTFGALNTEDSKLLVRLIADAVGEGRLSARRAARMLGVVVDDLEAVFWEHTGFRMKVGI